MRAGHAVTTTGGAVVEQWLDASKDDETGPLMFRRGLECCLVYTLGLLEVHLLEQAVGPQALGLVQQRGQAPPVGAVDLELARGRVLGVRRADRREEEVEVAAGHRVGAPGGDADVGRRGPA